MRADAGTDLGIALGTALGTALILAAMDPDLSYRLPLASACRPA
jgi:hypothetical protein